MAEREKPGKGILTPAEYYKKIGKDDKQAILDLNKKQVISFIPTGSWPINAIIGDGTMTGKPGGFPRGHITEIVGDESSGKSTLLMSGIREAQRMGELCVLLDFEQTFHAKYAQNLGLNLDRNKLIVSQPLHFQQGARMIFDALRMRPAIIGVDSVSAMTPLQVLEGSVDEGSRIGLQAQLMSAFLSYITKFLKDSNVALIFANQLRQVIKTGAAVYQHGPDEESSGGKALKYYSSLRLNMKKGAVEKVERMSALTGKKEKEPVNVKAIVSVIKNKIDVPFKQVPVYIKFGMGFDNIQSIIDLATNLNVIKRNGTLYTFTHDNEKLINATGKQALWDSLNNNEKILKRLQDSLVIKVDEGLKEEYKEEEDGATDVEALLNNVGETFVEKVKAKKEAKQAKENE